MKEELENVNQELLGAAKGADANGVRFWLEAGANPNEAQEVNCPDAEPKTPLAWALKKESFECAQALLDGGADVNHVESFSGHTPLHWAALGRGNGRAAQELLRRGAWPWAMNRASGATALALAAWHSNEMVLVELAHQPSADMFDHRGCLAIHWAAESGGWGSLGEMKDIRIRCFKWLAEISGVNARGRYGQTPLMSAAEKGDPEWLVFLMSLGADPLLKDDDKNGPLHALAKKGGAWEGMMALARAMPMEEWAAPNGAGKAPQQLALEAGHKELARAFALFAEERALSASVINPNRRLAPIAL